VQKGRGGGSRFGSPLLPTFSRRRMNPRVANDGGAWGDAPPLFLLSFGFTELVPTLLWIFLNGCFVILELFNVIFV